MLRTGLTVGRPPRRSVADRQDLSITPDDLQQVEGLGHRRPDVDETDFVNIGPAGQADLSICCQLLTT